MISLNHKLEAILKDFHWRNFNWQVSNYGLSGVLLIMFYVVLARFWSLEEFGNFYTIMVWMAVFSLTADLGLDFWVTKNTSLIKEQAYPVNLVVFRILFTAFISLIFIFFAYLQSLPMKEFCIFIFGTFVLNITHFFSCYLRGCEKLSVEAKLTGLRMIIFIACGLIAVFSGLGLQSIALCYLASTIIMAVLVSRELKKLNFRIYYHSDKLSKLLKRSLLIWLSTLLLGLTIKLETLILGALTNQENVAIFGAASRFFEGGLLIVTAFLLTTFPKLVQCYKHDTSQYSQFSKRKLKLLLAFILIASICGIVFGKLFFVSVFGINYQPSLPVFIGLMLILPITASACFLNQVLIIANRALSVIFVLFIGLGISVGLNYLLIPLWHFEGVLISIAVKELFVLLSMLLILNSLPQNKSIESF